MSYSDHTSAATPQSSFGTLTLAGVLDDLAARFIVNLPPDELESMDRVCFQIEQACVLYSALPGLGSVEAERGMSSGGEGRGTSERDSAGAAGKRARGHYFQEGSSCDLPAWAGHQDGRGRGFSHLFRRHVGWDPNKATTATRTHANLTRRTVLPSSLWFDSDPTSARGLLKTILVAARWPLPCTQPRPATQHRNH